MIQQLNEISDRVQALAQKVKNTNIKKVVDDPEWQELRLWLKGKWAKQGAECVRRMKEYFDKDKNDPYRVRRLLNYLTCSGFRTGAIKEPSANKLREEVRDKWKELLGDKATHRTGGDL
jgi:hypothetical protein